MRTSPGYENRGIQRVIEQLGGVPNWCETALGLELLLHFGRKTRDVALSLQIPRVKPRAYIGFYTDFQGLRWLEPVVSSRIGDRCPERPLKRIGRALIEQQSALLLAGQQLSEIFQDLKVDSVIKSFLPEAWIGESLLTAARRLVRWPMVLDDDWFRHLREVGKLRRLYGPKL